MGEMMDWTTDSFLQKLYADTQPGRSRAAHTEAPQQRRARLQHVLKRALGRFPERDVPLAPVLLERRDYGEYMLERIAYTTMEQVNVPVLVLVPKGGQGPYPAVLACHGHGNGQWDAAGLDSEGRELADPGIHNRFAARLAQAGMVVAIPEIMGFGVRRMAGELAANPNYSSCGTLSSQLLLYGRTLAGMRVYEAIRAIDFLSAREDVDAGRIGVLGFSGGGLIAAYTAALDERLKAAVLSGWTNTFRGSILDMHHCIDNYLPGLLLEAEQPDLTGLIAPRPLLVEAGVSDPIFPLEHTRQAAVELEATYAAWNASNHFQSVFHAGGHEISGEASLAWLQQQLTR
ncbi:acetylxylan esterase [Paenibacillus tritici]|uniref:alpha/beta hydrolase family protein n=1 Tax=Paenibacillus tritici TaxID=1873425 RepID=UPI001BA81B00|nr:alpha/beta hydrolase family protein [Paenibacillus tritici]QUL53410.1 acetylxylan esterase [Paenibacillus tritici]